MHVQDPTSGNDTGLPSLDDLESDAGHVLVMMDIACDQLQELSGGELASLNRHGATLWVTRDLVERLATQLGQLASNAPMRRNQRHQVAAPAPVAEFMAAVEDLSPAMLRALALKDQILVDAGASLEVLKELNGKLMDLAKQKDTPALREYVDGLQVGAMEVQSLLEGVEVLLPERQALAACEMMVTEARQKAKQLNNALDSMNLPEG